MRFSNRSPPLPNPGAPWSAVLWRGALRDAARTWTTWARTRRTLSPRRKPTDNDDETDKLVSNKQQLTKLLFYNFKQIYHILQNRVNQLHILLVALLCFCYRCVCPRSPRPRGRGPSAGPAPARRRPEEKEARRGL